MFHELHFYDVQVFIPDDRVDVKIQLDTSSLLEHSVFIRLSGSDQDWNKRDSDENSNYMRHILSYSQKKDLLIAHIFHFCKLGKDITELVDQVWDFRKYISQDSQISFKDTIYSNLEFKSMEHYFHSMKYFIPKSNNFHTHVENIRKIKDSNDVTTYTKAYPYMCSNFCNIKDKVMKDGLILKFYQNPELRKKLVNTTAKVLFENKIKNENKYFGRDEYFNSVIVESEQNLTGQIKEIKIKNHNHNTLFGEIKLDNDKEKEFAA